MRKPIIFLATALLAAGFHAAAAPQASAAGGPFWGELYTPVGPGTWYPAKCATPKGNSTANGTIITLWNCTGDELQKWDHDGYQIVHKASGKCLTPQGDGYDVNGAVLTLWPCEEGGNNRSQQFWSSDWFMHAKFSDKCLTNKGGSSGNGTYLTLWTCASDFPPEQHWQMRY
ncbi:RICIN domain-containing protein [Kitasatospora purpeofusca]